MDHSHHVSGAGAGHSAHKQTRVRKSSDPSSHYRKAAADHHHHQGNGRNKHGGNGHHRGQQTGHHKGQGEREDHRGGHRGQKGIMSVTVTEEDKKLIDEKLSSLA